MNIFGSGGSSVSSHTPETPGSANDAVAEDRGRLSPTPARRNATCQARPARATIAPGCDRTPLHSAFSHQ